MSSPPDRGVPAAQRVSCPLGFSLPSLHDYAHSQIWCASIAMAGDIVAWMQMLKGPRAQLRARTPSRSTLVVQAMSRSASTTIPDPWNPYPP